MKLDTKKLGRFQSSNNVAILQNNLGSILSTNNKQEKGKTPLGLNLEIPLAAKKEVKRVQTYNSSRHLLGKYSIRDQNKYYKATGEKQQ